MLGTSADNIHQMTSSFLIQYHDPVKRYFKKSINIGLSLKNWSKKKYVKDFVRFKLKKDQKHGTWEYSEKCVDIISLYYEKYPEAWKALEKAKKSTGIYNPISELYPREDGLEDT